MYTYVSTVVAAGAVCTGVLRLRHHGTMEVAAGRDACAGTDMGEDTGTVHTGG